MYTHIEVYALMRVSFERVDVCFILSPLPWSRSPLITMSEPIMQSGCDLPDTFN